MRENITAKHLPADLLAINIFSVILSLAALVLPVPGLRPVLGFPFLVFFPGYVLMAALYPGTQSLNGTARVALSLGISIVCSVFIGLLLNYTPWGIRLQPLVIALTLFIIIVSSIAWHRRKKRIRPRAPDFSARLANWKHAWRQTSKSYRGLAIAMLIAVVGGGSALGYLMPRAIASQPFTEFYILGVDGQATNYPHQLHPGEPGTVIASIANHEGRNANYQLEIVAAGGSYDATQLISLKPGQTWQKTVSFSLPGTGDNQKVEFILHQESGAPDEIRYLWVNVR